MNSDERDQQAASSYDPRGQRQEALRRHKKKEDNFNSWPIFTVVGTSVSISRGQALEKVSKNVKHVTSTPICGPFALCRKSSTHCGVEEKYG